MTEAALALYVCLITRPRTLEGPDLERLHDLADIALREILGLTTR